MAISTIPIIDIFAGPGGLGEGFSSLIKDKKRVFEIKLSIEKDPVAHQTLRLRAFFRQFPVNSVPDDYYDYLKGIITIDDLKSKYPEQWLNANEEALCLTLGEDSVTEVIKQKLGIKKTGF